MAMKAMAVTKFGGLEVLRLCNLDEPVPGPRDLLIEVYCAALNPIDFKIRRGAFREGRSLPFIPGYDVSGVVRNKGPEALDFAIGDEVYASPSLLRDGAHAALVCVDSRTVSLKPRTLDHRRAAALPLVTLTSWEALYERAQIRTGETLLIHAGGGGVGHIAIQLAKLRGCRVLATASRRETLQLCHSLGADLVINYIKEDFVERVKAETDGHGCDVIFDPVGGEVFDRSAECLAVNGRLVTCVGTGSIDAMRHLFVQNATVHFEFMGAPTVYGIHPEKQGEILCEVAQLVDRGKLEVHVSRAIGLEDVAEGHRVLETQHSIGKIVVQIR